MRSRAPLLALCLASCWTPERRVSEEAHGRFVAVEYAWDDLWGPCPKSHTERRLYGPDGDLRIRNVRGMSDSPDGRWTVGQSDQAGFWLFAIDHRAGHILPFEGRDDLMAIHRWAPAASRVLLQRIGVKSNVYGLVVLDLDREPPGFMPLFVRPYGRSEESIGWAPDGKSIAFLERGPQESFELVQIRVDPAPAEVLREPLEKIGVTWWDRYVIRWDQGRARAVPKS
jgi:hypothetical protein